MVNNFVDTEQRQRMMTCLRVCQSASRGAARDSAGLRGGRNQNEEQRVMSVRITCIKKAAGYHEDPHVAISELGWTNEQTGESNRTGRLEMYRWVKEGGQAYVRDSAGNVAYLIAKVSRNGNPYVQTAADGTPTDNLLKLVECRP